MGTVGNRIRESSVSTGTGDFTLDGAAAAFQSFITGIEAVAGVASPRRYADVNYLIAQTDSLGNNTDIEIGTGTVLFGTGAGGKDVLQRDTVVFSSNGGALVDFGAGTKTVANTVQAEDIGSAVGWVLRKTSDQNPITEGSDQKITWEETVYSNAVTVSLANNRITIDQDGTYVVSANLGSANASAGPSTDEVDLYKNGSPLDTVRSGLSISTHQMNGGFTIHDLALVNGDYLEIYVNLASQTGTKGVVDNEVTGETVETCFSGFRRGA
jgi:hypothetical protein